MGLGKKGEGEIDTREIDEIRDSGLGILWSERVHQHRLDKSQRLPQSTAPLRLSVGACVAGKRYELPAFAEEILQGFCNHSSTFSICMLIMRPMARLISGA